MFTVMGHSLHARQKMSGTQQQADSEQRVNYGIKAGFNSTLLLINDFSLDGTYINEVQNNYKVGYFGSLFMRINLGKHFLQPEISYAINKGSISFSQPQEETAGAPIVHSSISSTIHSIEMPLLYGFNVIKEDIYGLAIFGGPKLRYLMQQKGQTTFTNLELPNLNEELRPFNFSCTLGVAVTIHRLFFDFRYDIGLHNISRKMTYDLPSPDSSHDGPIPTGEIKFHRHDNTLSFSMGIIF